jgi:hypothetical protein
MGSSSGKYADQFSGVCLKELRKFFKEGKTLNIPEISSKAVPVKSFAYAIDKMDPSFFHYTGFKLLRNLAKIGDIDGAFWFFRSAYKKNGTNMYVAEDDQSTSSMGPFQIKLKIDPDALIFSGSARGDTRDVIDSHFPDLKTCWNQKSYMSSGNTNPAYFDLILEENKIDLQDYYFDGMWFQIIRKSAIQKISVGKHP